MDNNPVETSELLAFTQTVNGKSVTRAAAELGVPRATISRRLARLEKRLGTRLLRRTTRSLALTDAGEAFYKHARIVLDAVEEAESSLRHGDDAIRGNLRVSVPPISDPSFFAMICAFAKKHPALKVHVHASSELVDLQRGGYDVVIRASQELEPGLVARTLARASLVAVAAAKYLDEHGTPKTVRDLRNHQCLMGFGKGETPQSHWPTTSGSKVHVEGTFFSSDIALLRDAAIRGLGIALLPTMTVHSQLERGELLQVLPGVIGAESRVVIAYPEREFVPPAVRAFVDAVVPWAERELTGSACTGQHKKR
ncbi:MAG: LysR family transcriptional regulator [Deltaproteobacteria bacterium]|nr:LysR family transcriptional regulator [Deltaproteobacteria bacterium]